MFGYNLGNKTQNEAIALLKPRFVELESSGLTFAYKGKKFSNTLYEWGVRYEATSSAEKAYSVGREGNFFHTTKKKLSSWFDGVILEPVVKLDEDVFSATYAEIAGELEEPMKEPGYRIGSGGELEIVEGKKGLAVEESKLRKLILEAALERDFCVHAVPVQEVLPEVGISQIEEAKQRVQDLVFSPPTVKYRSKSWVLEPPEVLSLLAFSRGTDGNVEIQINQLAMENFIAEIASEINRPPRGGTFELEDGKVIRFALPQEGFEVEVGKAKMAVFEAVLNPNSVEVDLPVKVTEIGNDTNKYGIRKLLAMGSSNFEGSSAGREHNVDLASSRLDGILIPPGEVFSFNNSLGEVTSQTGYRTSYIIKNGRTILGVGGGVCQVSTTMFRAALNAGLPIVERAAHAYRVHYYEHDKGPGFDATVYAPSPDLKFKNDTPAHILIKRTFNAETKELKFSLYGTDDGRKVNITEPIIHSQTPPPEPAYIEDDSLPPGEQKKVDWAAWGAKVSVKRKVTRNGEVLQEDIFYSNYQPWQAVYLVGQSE